MSDAREARLRRKAANGGLRLRKDRARARSAEHQGGYKLNFGDVVVVGGHFELSLEDVEAFIAEDESRQAGRDPGAAYYLRHAFKSADALLQSLERLSTCTAPEIADALWEVDTTLDADWLADIAAALGEALESEPSNAIREAGILCLLRAKREGTKG